MELSDGASLIWLTLSGYNIIPVKGSVTVGYMYRSKEINRVAVKLIKHSVITQSLRLYN